MRRRQRNADAGMDFFLCFQLFSATADATVAKTAAAADSVPFTLSHAGRTNSLSLGEAREGTIPDCYQ